MVIVIYKYSLLGIPFMGYISPCRLGWTEWDPNLAAEFQRDRSRTPPSARTSAAYRARASGRQPVTLARHWQKTNVAA